MYCSTKKVFKPLLVLVTLLLVSLSSQAGLFGNSQSADPRPVEEVFTFQLEKLNDNKVLLRWDILADYYLYDNRMIFSNEKNIRIKEISRSETKSKDDPLFGKVDVYYHDAEVVLQLLPEEGSTINEQKLDLTIGYQGCWDGGVCYPPVTTVKTMTLDATKAAITTDQNANSNELNRSVNTSSELPVNSKPPSKPTTLSEQDQFSEILSSGELWIILLAFFVAGLALSLTPCVFPMIPILSSIIAGQGEKITTTRAVFLTTVYILAVSVTYTIAGVIAGLFGENLQVIFQTPWVIGLFSAIFVALALSMFGFYELQLPAALQSKLSNASNEQSGGSVTGVAIMGFLSALIVGPCMAAPLAGALIYIGQTADPVLGGMALFSLSIGMGVPLLIIGASAGHILPKVGQWMNAVKAAFGVLLILMAIYMLDRIVSIEITMLLTAITLLISAVYMGALEPLKEQGSNWLKLFKGVALLLMIYSGSLFIGLLSGSNNMLYPLKRLAASGGGVQSAALSPESRFNKITTLAQLDVLLAQAKANAQPVMLDFYADWCISCVELEYMLEETEVAKALQSFMLVKVDLTDYNDDAKAFVQEYEIFGPPALEFYNREGVLQTQLSLVGLIAKERFLEHIAPLTN